MPMKLAAYFVTIFLSAIPLLGFSQPDSSSVCASSNCLKDRLSESDKRYPSFKLALQLLDEREAKTLVETGTARYGDQQFGGDGGSTIIFGDWANQHEAMLYSVDSAPAAIDSAKSCTKAFAEHIQFSCSDSIQFLDRFDRLIDFIYLDSHEYDCQHPLASQDHHLREIISAYPALHKKSIVMIDDCDLPGGGQGKLAIDFLIGNDWKIVHQGYQTILTQE